MTVQFTSGDFRRLPSTARRPARAARGRGLRVAAGIAVGLSLVVTVTWLVKAPSQAPHGDAERPALAPPAWTSVARPVPAFTLDLSGLLPEKQTYEARVHAEGGGREDIFEIGAPGSPGGHLRLVAYRPGAEARPSASFFLAVARSAAEAGFAVARSTVGAPLKTKLGAVEAAEVTLTAEGREHGCIAWRFETEGTDLRLSGWLCGGQNRALSPTDLVCVLDRLDLSPTSGDRALREVFASADRRRVPGCTPPRAAPAPHRRPA